MNNPVQYSDDQKDALQELLNVAMGKAADSLAKALGVYVRITIPSSDIIGADRLGNALEHIDQQDIIVTGIRQAFFGDLRGEAVTVFGAQDCHQIADLMGYDELDEFEEQELLLDITNVLVGACMVGFGGQINANIGFSAPKIMAVDLPVKALLSKEAPSWAHSLVIKFNFGLAERSFLCELIFFMPESSIEKVRDAVELFIESI